jgi:hypothetical protein
MWTMNGFKNYYFIQQFSKEVEPLMLHNFLGVFLAKCMKHLVLYIMKNIISECMWVIILNQKFEFYEGRHENQSKG